MQISRLIASLILTFTLFAGEVLASGKSGTQSGDANALERFAGMFGTPVLIGLAATAVVLVAGLGFWFTKSGKLSGTEAADDAS